MEKPIVAMAHFVSDRLIDALDRFVRESSSHDYADVPFAPVAASRFEIKIGARNAKHAWGATLGRPRLARFRNVALRIEWKPTNRNRISDRDFDILHTGASSEQAKGQNRVSHMASYPVSVTFSRLVCNH